MSDPLATYTIRSLLKSAEHFEIESARFYREAISRVPRGEARELLRTLAEEEDRHCQRLREAATDDIDVVVRMAPDLAELPAATNEPGDGNTIESGAGPQAIVDTAAHREEAAYAFYHALARQSAGGTAEGVFAYLAGEEQKHMDMIKQMRRLVQDASGPKS